MIRIVRRLGRIGNRMSRTGTYLTPDRLFQDVMMDICENLNSIKGHQHLLLIQCLLTDFVIIIPLKTKKASEIEHMLMIALLQQRNVERIHSDNGPGFRSLPHLAILAAMHIKVVATASLSPIGRGKIERLVGITKIMMRRILATRPSYNWAYIPMLVAIAINTTISPRTGFKPCVMVGGSEQAGLTFMDLQGIAPLHFMIKNDRMHVEELHKDLQKSLKIARERLIEVQNMRNLQLNKNKINKDINVNDYVFVLDRAKVAGASRPLKTKLQCTPNIVISVRHTSSVVRRLSDGFTSLYSHNDLKRYSGGNPLFKDLPKEVKEILVNKFSDLLAEDLTTIARYDPLEVPNALQLIDFESGEPIEESGKDGKLAESTESPENKEDPDEVEVDKYLKDIDSNDLIQDLKELQKENPKAKTQKLFDQAELGSDSEDEGEDQDTEWTRRLRPRTGKTVRFK